MDLHTIQKLVRPASANEITGWREGNAWLAGGTWLFSEPQPKLDTLIDLQGLNWRSLEIIVGRAGACRNLPDRRDRAVPRTIGVDCGPVAVGVQSLAADVV